MSLVRTAQSDRHRGRVPNARSGTAEGWNCVVCLGAWKAKAGATAVGPTAPGAWYIQRLDAEDRDHPLQIVGQDVEAHLRSHVVEATSSGGCVAPIQAFSVEGVLDGSPSDAHGLGRAVEPGLHGVDHCLMLPAGAPLLGRGALRLEGSSPGSSTGSSGGGGLALFDGGHAAGQQLSRRAAVDILLGDVDEVLLCRSGRRPWPLK